jgi:hypothetical protein
VIKYRLTPLQRIFPLLVGVLAAFAAADLATLVSSQPLSMGEIWGVLEGLGAMCLAVLIFTQSFDVTLTPQGVIVQGVGGRLMEWSDITDVSVEKAFGNRKVVLTRIAGKRVRLRAPQSYLDRHFDEKFQAIYACWLGQYPWQ